MVSRRTPSVPATSRGNGVEPGVTSRTPDRYLRRRMDFDPYAGVLHTRRNVKPLDADSAPQTVVSHDPRQPSNPPPPKERWSSEVRPSEQPLGSWERLRRVDSSSRAPCRCDHRRGRPSVRTADATYLADPRARRSECYHVASGLALQRPRRARRWRNDTEVSPSSHLPPSRPDHRETASVAAQLLPA